MAGIAFRLQKLLKGQSLTDIVKAYLYSSVIASGPLIIVIVMIASIQLSIQNKLSIVDKKLFMGIVVYAYAFSMVGIAPVIYVVTRYLADKYYLKQFKVFVPSYLSVLEFIFLIQSCISILFLYDKKLLLLNKALFFMLILVLSGIWIAMIYLSAGRNYIAIVMSFLMGGIIGIGGGHYLGIYLGLSGFLLGLLLGQLCIFFLLTTRIFNEFGVSSSHDFSFLMYFKKNKSLIFVGTFYYVGIWVDKFVFWASPISESVIPGLKVFETYDTPMFISYLTVIPSMAFFLIQMETSFVYKYDAYYKSIRERSNYKTIEFRRDYMIRELASQFQKYAVVQGIFSAVIIVFVLEIAEAFQLNLKQLGVLRIGILGAFLQMGYLMVLNIFFYFDFQKEAAWITFLFLFCNGVFTFITYKIGIQSYGFGYTLASLVTVSVSFLMLNYKLKNINYYTFMKQPIFVPKFKFEGE